MATGENGSLLGVVLIAECPLSCCSENVILQKLRMVVWNVVERMRLLLDVSSIVVKVEVSI